MTELFQMMYGKYYSKLPDKAAYIKRIGLDGEELRLNKEGLDRLQFAHLCKVPFETLDIFDYGVAIDFGIEDMFDKVVVRRRGGYCFELNAIFMSLLEAVGFEVYPVGVRILRGSGDDEFIPPIAHRASIAMIGGKRYYTDVGFGLMYAPGISVCIDEYGEQDIRGETYTVRDGRGNKKIITRHTAEGLSDMFIFDPEPFNIPDFIAYNKFISETRFRAKRIANLRTPDGGISVDGDILRKTENGIRAETPLATSEDAFKALTEEFGMILIQPLSDIAVNPQFPF